MTQVAFVTWDGPGQTYLESLFFPIFEALGARGYSFHVLQFTWEAPTLLATRARIAASRGVQYVALPVWKTPPVAGVLATAASGAAYIARHARAHDIDIVLARSVVPATMARSACNVSRARFVFDADGLPGDERVEFAGWAPSSSKYRIWRKLEAHAVRRADSVIARTHAAKQILVERCGVPDATAKIFVAPNGKDPRLFSPGNADRRLALRASCGVPPTAPWLVFAGAIGPQYQLPRALELFERVQERRPDARLHILTGQPDRARQVLEASSPNARGVWVGSVDPEHVAGYMAAADLGIALRSNTLSQRAVSPIKIAEYLLCGLPFVTTRGVGDLDSVLSRRVALALDELSPAALESAVDWFLSDVLEARDEFRLRCRALGVELFSLERCVAVYADALHRALARTEAEGVERAAESRPS